MFDLSGFIDACRSALEQPNPALAVWAVMAEVVADPTAIEAALGSGNFEQEPSAHYGFLHQSPDLTLLQVVMPGYLRGPPHNHLVWAVIGLYRGRENNIFYRRDGDCIVQAGQRDLVAPEVLVLDAETIHRIANPLAQPSHALHVYGGLLANPARSLWNSFTLEEEPFQVSALLEYERDFSRGRTAGAS